ncbi:MAG: universal stress protein [Bacteroidota bacterium]
MKILIPLDFSENSEKALQFALNLNKDQNHQLILVHVVEIIYDFASQAAMALDSMYKDSEKMMKELQSKYSTDQIKIKTHVKDGTPSITLAKLAEEEDVDMIVMGTKGASGMRKVIVGSTAANLIKESSVPVLLVPIGVDIKGIRRIVMALEFANHEEYFVDWVYQRAVNWSFSFEVLHIETKGDFREKLLTLGIQKYLEDNYPKSSTLFHKKPSQKVDEGFEQFLEEEEDILLVMCHNHMGLWDQFWSKSQSLEMAYHSKVPLLIMV